MDTGYLIFAAGVIVGLLISKVRDGFFSGHGVIDIDTSKPESPKFFLRFDELKTLAKKKRCVLEVNPNADLSHLSQK